MTKVLMSAPTTRDLPIPYVKSLWTTEIKGTLAWDIIYGQAVDVARNIIVERFLSNFKDFDYLLMHDSDCSFAPGSVQRLVDRDLPVVTGIIFRRGFPTVPTIGKFVGLNPDGRHLYSFVDVTNKLIEIAEREKVDDETPNQLLLPMQDGDIQEIDGAGAHFMLIRRDVLEAIKENWYQCTTVNGGEDFFFCRQVQKAGFKLYVDYSVYTGHHLGGTLELGFKEFVMYSDKVKMDAVWTM